MSAICRHALFMFVITYINFFIKFNTKFRRGWIYLQTSKQSDKLCKNIFKKGDNKITKNEFTRVWIDLINRLEKNKYKNFTK